MDQKNREMLVRKSLQEKPHHEDTKIFETIKVVIQALVIAVLIRTFLFQPFNIPSGSLVPTLLVGDYLFVSKYTYGFSKHSIPFSPNLFEGRIFSSAPQRGDIAVFKLPKDNSTDYIKRVIGLPGDRIQMVDGILHINGQPVKREEAGTYPQKNSFGVTVEVPRYRITLPNGVVHYIIEREGDKGYWDNTYVYTVPRDHYFMMGDNRDNSSDSRDETNVGMVPIENFVGRAEIIFFSIDEGSPAWKIWEWPNSVRWRRIFSMIR